MKGRIHCDIFNINKYMINNVDISLKFTRTKEDFCLFGSSTEDYKVLIDNAFLKVRRQTISPAVMAAHLLALERTTAKYPIKRVVVLPITIPFKTPKTTLTGIYKGIMPKRVVFGLVSTEAFDGNKGSNPFNFQNFGVTNLCLKVASKALPYSSAFELDFENNNYIEAYTSLFQNIREAGNNISYIDYANGNTIYAFDLTPDLCSSEHFSLLKDGSLDLDIKFKTTPAVSTTAIFYLEFDNIIEIDKQRNILFDYKV